MQEVNGWLKTTYGCNDAGNQLYRVVFSDSQTEKRFGVFQEHVGKLFLREYRGLKEVPKYPWIKHRWVFERWMPPALVYDPEIPGTADGSYEPMQIFEHTDGHEVPVTREICAAIIWNLTHLPLAGDSASRYKANEDIEFNKEVEINRLHLEEAGSPLKKDRTAII